MISQNGVAIRVEAVRESSLSRDHRLGIDICMQHVKLTWEERIESLKAGGFAASSAAIVFSMTTLANDFLATQLPLVPINYWISGAIALLAAFLFGVTYRYIIRQDQNSHLKSGAVLAFGLVRGLAQVDIAVATQNSIGAIAILAIESVLLFAVAQWVLDGAIAQGWLQRFKG